MNEGERSATDERVTYRRKRQWYRKKWVLFGGMGAVAIIGVSVVLFLLLHKPTQAANDLPTAVLQQIHGFRPYYFQVGSTTGFTLEPQTVGYDEGVLIFEMKNPVGKTLAITEEPTANYDISSLSADKQFNTGYGQGFITDSAARTTGALFTSDKTWILINAPDPIGADLMQQILTSLVPEQP